MPLSDYEIDASGGGSFDDLGVIDGEATISDGGAGDSMTIIFERTAREASPIPLNAIVKLKYQGTQVWQGISQSLTWSASTGSTLAHRLTLNCVGLNAYLAAQPFVQTWNLTPDAVDISSVALGGPDQSLADIISAAVGQADAGLGSGVISTDVSSVPAFNPAQERMENVSCLDVVQRVQGWMPGVRCRWNSASGVLEWLSVLRPGNALGLPASSDTRSVALASMNKWSGTKRVDLLAKSNVLVYLRRVRTTDIDGNPIIATKSQKETNTVDNGGLNSKSSVVKMDGYKWDATADSGAGAYVDGDPFPDVGLGKLLLGPFADIYCDLNFSTEIDWTWKPLVLVNVSDGSSAGFDDAWSSVRSVTHTFRNDITTVQAGSPTGINKLRDMTRPARTRQDNNEDQRTPQTYGFKPHKDPKDDDDTEEITRHFLTADGFVTITLQGKDNEIVDPTFDEDSDWVPVWSGGVPTWEDVKNCGEE